MWGTAAIPAQGIVLSAPKLKPIIDNVKCNVSWTISVSRTKHSDMLMRLGVEKKSADAIVSAIK
jgi:hypothetical protein